MPTNTHTSHEPARTRPSRRHRAWPLFALLVALGLVVVACGDDDTGPGVADVDSSTTKQPGSDDSSGSDQVSTPDPVAYAQCMRDNGVPGFPDPDSDGRFSINANELGIPPGSPQFEAADAACADLLPQQGDEQQAEDHQAMLRYAQCMRDEGITDFPDPPAPTDGPSTETRGGEDEGGVSIDLDSPQYQAAHDACKDLLPAGNEGPTVGRDTGGG